MVALPDRRCIVELPPELVNVALPMGIDIKLRLAAFLFAVNMNDDYEFNLAQLLFCLAEKLGETHGKDYLESLVTLANDILNDGL